MRTAVESTWLHGNLEAIQQLFGFSVDADRGKPTNAEFLSMLAEHVRRETAAVNRPGRRKDGAADAASPRFLRQGRGAPAQSLACPHHPIQALLYPAFAINARDSCDI